MAKTLDEAGVKRLIQEIKGANKNLNAPIPISTENTPESMAQNVKNIADYVEKAKAAGIANVNGMAVTCSIYDDYSGVGYLYSYADSFSVQGVLVKDDLVDNMCFSVSYSGRYSEKGLIVSGNEYAEVSSSMLDEGARRPIILTPSTTEVDEETYQKLLSDNVDVVFKDATDVFNILYDRVTSETTITLTFVSVTCSDTTDASSYVFSYFPIFINKAAPHTLQVSGPAENNLEQILNDSGYLNKSSLTPVLQEIDLRGTDADRKAKLDQFETDWKALTGASDLTGAIFVGRFGITEDIVERNVTGIMTYSAGDTATEKNDNCFYGICNGYSFSEQKSQIAVKVSCTDGSLTITPLFSHLEAITIYTDNTPAHKQANLDNIAAYKANLEALGVDTTKGYMIPITASGRNGFLSTRRGNYPYAGYAAADSNVNDFYNILILGNGEYYDLKIQPKVSNDLTTTSKQIVGAINEVNALAKGYSTIFTPIELTTETAQNKTAIDARVAAFTAQGISLTNGCCIPVTYKGVYAGNISLINGDWYGLLVKNTNNPADNINIKLSADGTITEGNSAQ